MNETAAAKRSALLSSSSSSLSSLTQQRPSHHNDEQDDEGEEALFLSPNHDGLSPADSDQLELEHGLMGEASRRSSYASVPSVQSAFDRHFIVPSTTSPTTTRIATIRATSSGGACHVINLERNHDDGMGDLEEQLIFDDGGDGDDDDDDDEDLDTSERRNLLASDPTRRNLIFRHRNQHHTLFYRFIHFVDILLSIVLFSPLVAIFWYCTWSFLDDYFLPADPKLSNLITWLAGLIILLPSYVFQKDLQSIYVGLRNYRRTGTCLRVLMRIVYIYLVTLAVILEWRGVWNLFDLYVFNDWQTQISLALLALTFFCLTKTTRTLVATPFFLYMDDYHHFFTTEHKHQSDEFGYLEFSLDFLLTEIVECIALVAAWRGAENSFDAFVYPNNIVLKLATSFGSSHAIYVFVAFIQNFVFRKFSKSTLVARLVAEDFMYIVMFLSSVFSWKFYWDLMSLVVLSRIDGFYVFLGGHVLVFLVALVLKVSAILVGPGTSFLDGDVLDGSDDSYFQVNYLTTIYSHRLQRDAQHRLEPTHLQPNIN